MGFTSLAMLALAGSGGAVVGSALKDRRRTQQASAPLSAPAPTTAAAQTPAPPLPPDTSRAASDAAAAGTRAGNRVRRPLQSMTQAPPAAGQGSTATRRRRPGAGY